MSGLDKKYFEYQLNTPQEAEAMWSRYQNAVSKNR